MINRYDSKSTPVDRVHDRLAHRAAVGAGLLMPIYQVGELPPWTIRVTTMIMLALLGVTLASHRRPPSFDLWWLLLFGAFAFGTMLTWSVSGWTSLAGFVGGAVIGMLLVDDERARQKLIAGYITASAVSTSIALLAFVGGPDLQSSVSQLEGVWGLSYGSPAFSYSCAMALAMVFWRTRSREGRPWKAAGTYVVVTLLIAGLLASTGRGGLVAALISVPLLGLVPSKQSNAQRRSVVALVALSAASLFFFASPTLERFNLREAADLDRFSAGRLAIYESGWSEFLNGSIVGGRGLNVAIEVAGSHSPMGAHNALLAAALGGGLVALLAGIAIYCRSLVLAGRALRTDHPQARLAVAILSVGIVRGVFEVPGSVAGGTESVLFVMAYGLLSHGFRAPSTGEPADQRE